MGYNRIWVAGSLEGPPALRFGRDGSAETRFAMRLAGEVEVEVRCEGALATGIVDRIDPGDQALVEGCLANEAPDAAAGSPRGGSPRGGSPGSGPPRAQRLVVVATRVERFG